MSKELSASALQIEERKERMRLIVELARRETEELIKPLLYENPNVTVEDMIRLIKRKPIPINAFIREFMANPILGEKGLSFRTATDYFDTEADRLHPSFIRVPMKQNLSTYNGFHISELLIRDSYSRAKMDLEKEDKK